MATVEFWHNWKLQWTESGVCSGCPLQLLFDHRPAV